jgi:sugar (pentulose or hexulose) kinase
MESENRRRGLMEDHGPLPSSASAILASHGSANQAQATSDDDAAMGYSEWDARRIVEIACACLREVARQLSGRRDDLAGIGVTGQQHGVVLVDKRRIPISPLIGWRDRRGEQLFPGSEQTFLQKALALAGAEASSRTGCKLASGYMGVTLFHMSKTGGVPADGTACFLMDYFVALLTDRPPVTDPTCAASSGLFNITKGDWDSDLLAALELPRRLFPKVRPSAALCGGLCPALAEACALPSGLPVFVGIGDNQASFLGTCGCLRVGDPSDAVLVNVGTGGQVAVYAERFSYDPELETRPFPGGGFLLVSAGLSGGAAYAVLEGFFGQVGQSLFGVESGEPLYPLLNRLAAEVPAGADGLVCEPFFSGTRAQPECRASWTGVSTENFTPAHMVRALLEGMARTFRAGYECIVRRIGSRRSRLIGAGNGLRENPVLASLVAEAFAMPLSLPAHKEEAAFGAALLVGLRSGLS